MYSILAFIFDFSRIFLGIQLRNAPKNSKIVTVLVNWIFCTPHVGVVKNMVKGIFWGG